MNNITFKFESNSEIKKRKEVVQKFVDSLIDLEEKPLFISDEATIFDICSDDSSTLLLRIFNSYGIQIQEEQLTLKIWELIDVLQAELIRLK